jgi:hypothetical protein
MKVKDIVNLPEKKTLRKGFYGDDFAEGYNECLEETSDLPISKDKVIGILQFDMERLAKIIKEYMAKPRTMEKTIKEFYVNSSSELCDTIIAAKSDILTIKGDV